MKKTSMPNPVRTLGYECYRTSSPIPVKSPSSSQIQLPEDLQLTEKI